MKCVQRKIKIMNVSDLKKDARIIFSENCRIGGRDDYYNNHAVFGAIVDRLPSTCKIWLRGEGCPHMVGTKAEWAKTKEFYTWYSIPVGEIDIVNKDNIILCMLDEGETELKRYRERSSLYEKEG